MSSALSVRDATPGDAAAVRGVAQASWRDTYRDIFELLSESTIAMICGNGGDAAESRGESLELTAAFCSTQLVRASSQSWMTALEVS